MKNPVFLIAVSLTSIFSLVACSVAPIDTPTPAAPELRSGVLLENMDQTVSPGDNFHQYVNGNWINNTEIPADRASYGNFVILHEQSQANVRAIIETAASSNAEADSDEQKVGDLFYSYIDMETRNAKGVTPLQGEFQSIDAIDSYAELARFFAHINKTGTSVPFTLGQTPDFKDPRVYMMYTYQDGLGLPDREYYFNADETSNNIRAAYRKHIATMLSLAGVPEASDKADTIYALEKTIAHKHVLKEKTRDRVAMYNKISLSDLPELMPKFSWNDYLKEAGVAELDSLVVTQPEYMQALDDIIAQTPIDTWQTYLKWTVVNQFASALNQELDNQNFEFYSKTLNGIEEPQPHWRRAVNTVNRNLGEIVGKVYVKEHFPPAAKERMQDLVDNLMAAYEVSIRDLSWMSEDTKTEALEKLSKFRTKIGYPDKWRDYSQLKIKSDDLYGNLRNAAEFRYQSDLDRQSGPVDRDEWALTPQTVNAYYNPSLNEIAFPAAILQPPFFDMEADDAINYGAIGAVIGHEIGHGFDDAGSTFDGDGVLRNWWTEQDRTEFERRTKKLVDQYSAFKPFDDLSVNGEFTLGENIGDLGGLSIGLLAYQMSLQEKTAPVLDGFTGIQRVFIGYGQAWRSKIRDEALRSQISNDPHSPAEYRTNGAVRNVPEFYRAFGVSSDSTLYLDPDERVKIW